LKSLFRILGILLLLVAVALTSAILTMQLVIHGAEVSVPDMRGKSIAEADGEAARLGLRMHIANHFYSGAIPAGDVMDQSPAAGTRVRAGWPLRVIESLGAQKMTVPTLTGMQDRLAILQIHRAGLDLGSVAYLPWPQSVTGAVLAQMPGAMAKDVASPKVQLLIAAPPGEDSASQNALVMPNLVGKIFTGAALIVTHAGLRLAPVKEVAVAIPPVGSVNSKTAPKPPVLTGSVLAQTPAAGYRVTPGTTVTLTVAK
jgi:beta-lactam-binding protein with PASTA domain